MVDLGARHESCAAEIEGAVLRVLRSGQWVGGPVVAELETRMAERMGRRHGVGVGNGTDALELCLQALGVGAGDEVIIPAVSFFATAGAICRVGARPVLVDTLADRPLLDWSRVEAARSERCRAVIPVHLFGLDAGASSTDLDVIDDLAQAVGARPAPGKGRMAAVSFYPTKVLSAAGDGGMVFCDEPVLAARVRALGSHGASDGLHSQVEGSVGGNSRLDAIHAASLLAQLPALEARLARRRQILALYRDALGESVLAHSDGSPVSILCMRHPARDRLISHLRDRGIEAGCYYPRPLSEEPALAHARVAGALTHAEAFCAEAVALPCHGGLDDREVSEVIDAVRSLR